MQISISLFKKTYSFKIGHILLLLLIVGAAIRFYKLDYSGLWLDEIFSMETADPSLTFGKIYEDTKSDQPPTLFFLLNGWLKIFGYTDFAARSLSCIFGVLGILSMYFLGKEFKNERLGLIAAFLTTINYFHIGVSVEIRFYALVILLSALSFLFFLRAIKETKAMDFIWYSITTALLLNTHYFGMILFASQFLILLVVISHFKKNSRLFIGALIAGGVAGLSLLHIVQVINQDLSITSFHIEPLTLRYLSKFLWWYVYDPAAFLLYIVFGGLFAKILYEKIITKTFTVEDFILVAWLFLGFMIPFLYSIFRMPLFTNRYCAIQVPALILFIAMGFNSIEKKKLQLYSICILVVSSFLVSFIARPHYKRSWSENASEIPMMYFTMGQADKKLKREDWREVATFFEDKDENRVVFSQLASLHVYYFKKFGLELPVDHNYVNVKDLIQDKNEVWLLLHKYYKSKVDAEEFLPEQAELINQSFEFKDSVSFMTSKAVLYVRKTK